MNLLYKTEMSISVPNALKEILVQETPFFLPFRFIVASRPGRRFWVESSYYDIWGLPKIRGIFFDGPKKGL